jgi:hypothetical protein
MTEFSGAVSDEDKIVDITKIVLKTKWSLEFTGPLMSEQRKWNNIGIF